MFAGIKENLSYDYLAINSGIDLKRLPQHIAFIMDGNGRWAVEKGKSRLKGHLAGAGLIKEFVRVFKDLKIPVMTIFAFSSENWQRPPEEVDFLMNLFESFINQECRELKNNGVRLRFIGKIDQLNSSLQQKIKWAETETANGKELILNVAINYGARKEIIDAVSEIIYDIENNKITKKDINEKNFANYLYTRSLPDPDLLIRTSGEMRISNYLLWQIAYSELWITKTLWPDFTVKELLQAIYDYQHRDRRFGKVN
jgi:undecaprenyl diphosphate synthase